MTSPILRAVDFVSATTGWAGGRGIILATRDGGRTWRRQYGGTADIRSLDFVSGRVGWAVARGVLLVTRDAGHHWRPVAGAPTVQRVDFVSPTRGWGIVSRSPYLGGRLVFTRDGGRSWRPRPTGVDVYNVCFVNRTEGWTTTGYATTKAIVATADGGRDWQSLPSPPGTGGFDSKYTGWAALGCAAPHTVWALFNFGAYAGGVGHAVFRSTDGGEHWSAVGQGGQLPVGIHIVAAAASGPSFGPFGVIDARTAYLVGICGACADAWDRRHRTTGTASFNVTTDAGRTWSHHAIPLSGPAALRIDAVAFADRSDGWLVTGSSIWHTSDGGRTWRQQYGESEPAG